MTDTQASQPLFLPKLWTTLRSYSLSLFWSDLTAGVIVGIVALPLAIAFAIASGVPPERGLITAIVAGILISALGGSRVQIGGPTGAFVVIVFGIVQHYGMDGLLLCTLMAGLILIGMGLLRLGSFIRFIPYPLTVGFTAGIAVVIFSSQIKDFFGLQTGPLSGDTVHNWLIVARSIGTIHAPTLLLSLGSLAILIFWPRINRRVPAPIVALITATLIAQLFQLPVETIGSRFGAIPSGLPRPAWPALDLSHLRELVSPAFTVAFLCAIESLLSATVADGMIEGRHRSNTELIGQGIANIASALFGGMPATGAIARTATNVRNGGRTPVAGIIHALTLLGIMLLFGRWAQLIPLCALSAILVVVAYHMSEWHAFRALLKAPKMDVAVLVTTFGLTVLVDLTVAVEVGLTLALLLFMQRMTNVTTVRQVTNELRNEAQDETALRAEAEAISRRTLPAGVEVYEAEGAFFFGIAESLREALAFGKNPPKVAILRMRHVLVVDASALRALSDLNLRCRRLGATLLISGIHAQPLIAMEQSGLLHEFGEENVLSGIDPAITRARQLLEHRSP